MHIHHEIEHMQQEQMLEIYQILIMAYIILKLLPLVIGQLPQHPDIGQQMSNLIKNIFFLQAS